MQDLIVSAQIVVHRDDVGEATKATELGVFRDTLAQGGTLAGARHRPISLQTAACTAVKRELAQQIADRA